MGRELANELGIKFMETSAKVNEGVEEAFFALARCVRFVDTWSIFAHKELDANAETSRLD